MRVLFIFFIWLYLIRRKVYGVIMWIFMIKVIYYGVRSYDNKRKELVLIGEEEIVWVGF